MEKRKNKTAKQRKTATIRKNKTVPVLKPISDSPIFNIGCLDIKLSEQTISDQKEKGFYSGIHLIPSFEKGHLHNGKKYLWSGERKLVVDKNEEIEKNDFVCYKKDVEKETDTIHYGIYKGRQGSNIVIESNGTQYYEYTSLSYLYKITGEVAINWFE